MKAERTDWMGKFWRLSLAGLCFFPQPVLCADLPAGTVVWWGMDVLRRGAHMVPTNGVLETSDGVLTNVVSIAAQHGTLLALKSDGTVFSLGLNLYGGLDVPAGLSNVVSVAVEGNSCWAIKRDGTVVRWGNDVDSSNQIGGLSNVASVAWVGYRSYLALKRDGSLMGMRFDDGSPFLPVKVGGRLLTNVSAISGLADTPVILHRDGSLSALERDRYGGSHGPTSPPFYYGSLNPIEVDGWPVLNVVAMARNRSTLLGLKRNGTVVAWSGNVRGVTNLPAHLQEAAAIAVSEQLHLALRSNGTVVAWGWNHYGQTNVPPGLTNVVAIAADDRFGAAITTGPIPASVYVSPRGRLEELEREADLIFKGCVVSSEAMTNASFPHWGKPHATRFRVITLLKGKPETDELIFWHNTSGPMAWSGRSPPSWHKLEVGACYLVFAARLDKPDYLYSPPQDATNRVNEFRQTYRDGITRTLDARPVAGRIREVHWGELSHLLHDDDPTNVLYAIERLDSMSQACRPQAGWRQSFDFKRVEVLKLIKPLLTSTNDSIAVAAINCFRSGLPCSTQLVHYVEILIQCADEGYSIRRRLAAIAALSDSRLDAVREALPRWLADTDEEVRAQAVLLLPDFSGPESEQALGKAAEDHSARVRAAVAEVIGKAKIEKLLPVLAELFSEPLGATNPVPPLTMENLQNGGRLVNLRVGDVHTSSGYALLEFDVSLTEDILKAHLDDAGFRAQFLCKLAEKDASPWLNDLTEVLRTRRMRTREKADTSGVEPKENYYRALMTLSGAHYRCWNTIYEHLKGLPFAAFAEGKLDGCLSELENAGTGGSREPLMLYELYRMKGLNRRAAEYRKAHEPGLAVYGISQFFDKIDERYPRNGMIPDQ